MRRSLVLLVAAAVSLVGAGAAQAEPESHYKPCVAKDAPPPFATYWLGPKFGGLALEDHLYDCDEPDFGEPVVTRPNQAVFVYGKCDTSQEGERLMGALRPLYRAIASDGASGCAPPVEVNTAPACDLNFSDLDFTFTEFRNARPPIRRARGVPAARFDARTLSLYTGDVTVTVFGENRAQVDRAVRALRPVEGAAAGPLPKPVPGHLTGRLYCGLPRPPVTAASKGGRRVRLRFELAAAGGLSGEVWPAGSKIDPELGVREDEEQFLFASGKGSGAGTVRVQRPGRYVGEAVATSTDGRKSVRVRFTFRVPR